MNYSYIFDEDRLANLAYVSSIYPLYFLSDSGRLVIPLHCDTNDSWKDTPARSLRIRRVPTPVISTSTLSFFLFFIFNKKEPIITFLAISATALSTLSTPLLTESLVYWA